MEGMYHPLQVSRHHPIEYLPRLIAVAHVFEGFGGVLAPDIEEDFFAAAVGHPCNQLLVLPFTVYDPL